MSSASVSSASSTPQGPYFPLLGLDDRFLVKICKRTTYTAVLALECTNKRLSEVSKDTRIWRHLFARFNPGEVQTFPTGSDFKMLFRVKFKEFFQALTLSSSKRGIPQTYLSNREFMLAVVSRNGKALQSASRTLKNDKDVVLSAVTEYGRALLCAPDMLKNDKDVVLAAVTQYGLALYYASDTLQNDKDVVLAAVTRDGWALEYASDSLQNDKNVCLAAVTQNLVALMYTSLALLEDPDVLSAAKKQAFWNTEPTL